MLPILLLLQEALPTKWYETPTGAAALVALIGVIAAPFVNSWIQTRRQKSENAGRLSDTTLTLSVQERKEVMDQLKFTHAKEIQFMQKQLDALNEKCARQMMVIKLSEYEARQRAHAYGGECYRLQGQVYKLQMELTKHDLPVPDFTFKSYPEIMQGLDEKVLQYKDELEEEMERELELNREVDHAKS